MFGSPELNGTSINHGLWSCHGHIRTSHDSGSPDSHHLQLLASTSRELDVAAVASVASVASASGHGGTMWMLTTPSVWTGLSFPYSPLALARLFLAYFLQRLLGFLYEGNLISTTFLMTCFGSTSNTLTVHHSVWVQAVEQLPWWTHIKIIKIIKMWGLRQEVLHLASHSFWPSWQVIGHPGGPLRCSWSCFEGLWLSGAMALGWGIRKKVGDHHWPAHQERYWVRPLKTSENWATLLPTPSDSFRLLPVQIIPRADPGRFLSWQVRCLQEDAGKGSFAWRPFPQKKSDHASPEKGQVFQACVWVLPTCEWFCCNLPDPCSRVIQWSSSVARFLHQDQRQAALWRWSPACLKDW